MPKMPLFLKRPLLVLALCAGLLGLWNWGIFYNLAKPAVLSLGPAKTVPAQAASHSGQPDSLSYPRLGISAPITNLPDASPLRTQDWDKLRQALYKGVGLAYDGNSFAAAPLAYLVGHSSDVSPHLYSSIFAGLGQAKDGDRFQVVVDGSAYTYQVVQEKVLNPYDTEAFSAASLGAGPSKPPRLALVTCWPVLTTRNRLVVVAERLAS